MSRREQSSVCRPYHEAASSLKETGRVGAIVALILALGWLGSCSDDPSSPPPPPPPPPQGLIVSDPASPSTAVGSRIPASRSPSNSVAEEIVYVSLPSGTVPTGSTATVRLVGGTTSFGTALFEGGFDPVPIRAQVGDSIDVVITNDASDTVRMFGLRVSATRPPVVVRTQPPRKKKDVPLNSAIIVVFSEPVDGATLSSTTIQLLRGPTSVAGTVRFLDPTLGATELRAEFVPDVELAPASEYQLTVTQQIADLDGDILAAPDTVPFTTGQSTTGPPASISLSVADTTLGMAFGTTFQMTATLRDADGNMLTNYPVTWTTSDSSVFEVSATGLLTAIEPGGARLTASAEGLTAGLEISVQPGPPASLTIDPPTAAVAAFDTISLTAIIRDAAGHLTCCGADWFTSAPAVAIVEGVGEFAQVIGVSPGAVTITARIVDNPSVSGNATITVGPAAPVATVTINADSLRMVHQGAVQLTATIRDAAGRDLSERQIPIRWTSNNAAVATVDTSGVVTAVGEGSAVVTAISQSVSDSVPVTVAKVGFVAVHAGGGHTCGLSSDGTAYCWGGDPFLGIGAVRVPYCPSSGGACATGPAAAVAGGLRYTDLDAASQTCGLVNGAAYCWGDTNPYGAELPVLSSSGPFSTVSAGGWRKTCGVTSAGAIHCWSFFYYDVVPGALTFSAVSVGADHTCGLTTAGSAHCWGTGHRDAQGVYIANAYGQFGDGSTNGSSSPVPVTGGLLFSSVTAGGRQSCGLTTSGEAYCWGHNEFGELGIGTTVGPESCSWGGYPPEPCSRVPVAVAGGLKFTAISIGWASTCAITSTGAAYCWGSNHYGQLGSGSTSPISPSPVAVAGGLTFRTISVGDAHACGVTETGITYCWGDNSGGKLGNGSETNISVPSRVTGQP